MAEFWEDFDKSTTDLLNDDYKAGHSLKLKQSSTGITFTSENTFSCPCPACCPSACSKAGVGGKLTAKYAHPSGFSLDKLQIDAAGTTSTEVGLTGVAPNAKFVLKTQACDKGDLFVEYKTPNLAVKKSIDIVDFASGSASGVYFFNNILAGLAASFKFSAPREISDYNFGLGYKAPKAFFSLKTTKKMSNFSFSARFAARDDLTVVGQLDASPQQKSHALTLGTVYKCNPNTTVRAKLSSSGLLATAVAQKIAKDFTVSGAFMFDLNKKEHKAGLHITLG